MLDTGDRIPAITAKDIEGEAVDLAELTAGSWSAVLFYRGHW